MMTSSRVGEGKSVVRSRTRLRKRVQLHIIRNSALCHSGIDILSCSIANLALNLEDHCNGSQ